jgi:hypothetical protein
MVLIVILLLAIIVILLGGGALVMWAGIGFGALVVVGAVLAVPLLALIKGVELVEWYRADEHRARRLTRLLLALVAALVISAITANPALIRPAATWLVGWFVLWYVGSLLLDWYDARDHRH